MADRRFSQFSLFRLVGCGLSLGLCLSACSDGTDDASDGMDNTGSTAAGGQTASGGNAAAGGSFATTGGQSAAGGQSTSGGQPSSGGEPGQTGGSASGGANGGASPSGGAASGGDSSTGGNGGDSTGGATGSGGSSSGECTRALLDGMLDDYFAALSAGDPSALPLANDAKFTENAQITDIGTTDFWMNAGETKHSQRALDTTQCMAAAQAVIPEGTTDLPVALRIAVEGAEITEVETIVVRPGDYTASFAVDSNPAAIISIADDIGWHDEVPEGDRATREVLIGWIDKYFRAFPSGVCDVTQACRRLENGGGDFACNTGASCTGDTPDTGGVFVPRVIVADELRGIAAGFTIFDFMTTGHLDMHMIKMSAGEVHAVQAILRDTGGESGWE